MRAVSREITHTDPFLDALLLVESIEVRDAILRSFGLAKNDHHT